MENNNNHNHNSSGNGFLLGVIVGVLITLLFTTKRGRAIFKDIMEKGIEKFANLEEVLRATEEDIEYEDGDDYIPAEPVEVTEPPKAHKVEKEVIEAPVQPKEKPVQQSQPAQKEAPAEPVETAQEKIEETKTTPTEEEKIEEKPVEEKPKTTRVKRLFRGLRKKS